MSAAESILRHVRKQAAQSATDSSLLRAFVERRDEAAFQALVQRHGPTVLRVCRRKLDDAHAAEDAFQATFLALSRSAKSIRQSEALAGWLFRTAQRIAIKAQAAARRRNVVERQNVGRRTADPDASLTACELLEVLDHELGQLSERDRVPLLLVYWQGRTYAQAARELSVSISALHGRLERGRARLADRLRSRGFTPGDLGAILAATTTIAVPSELLAKTAALTASGAIVPTGVAALATTGGGKVISAAVAALVIVAGTIGVAGGWAEQQKPKDKAKPAAAANPEVVVEAQPRVDRFGDPLPEGAVARLGTVRLRNSGDINQLAFSTDSKMIAAADNANFVCVWDTTTGKQIRRLATQGYTPAVAFSPDGKKLVVSGHNELPRWDVRTWEKLPSFPFRNPIAEKNLIVEKLVFSPDATVLACRGRGQVNNQNATIFLDGNTGEQLYRIEGQRLYTPPSFAFSPDSSIWAYADKKDHEIKLFDSRTGRIIRKLTGHTQPAATVAFLPDGKRAASTDFDGTLRFWEVATGKLLPDSVKLNATSDLAYSPDERFLVGYGSQLCPAVWDVRERKALTIPFEKQQNLCENIVISSDGRLVAGSYHRTLYLWDMKTGKTIRPSEGHEREVFAVSFAPDGKSIVSVAGESAKVRRWDAATGQELASIRTITEGAQTVAYSPDGKTIAVGTGGSEGTVWLLEALTGEQVKKMTIPRGFVTSIAFSADGNTLASRAFNKEIHIWSVASGQEIRRIAGHPMGYMPIAISPDGETVADGGDGDVCVWNVATGQERFRLATGERETTAVAYSPDGRLLASCGGDKVHLWSIAEGRQVGEFVGTSPWVTCVAFSPDSRTFVTNGRDFVVRLWEVASGRERRRFEGQQGGARCAAFSRDGRFLATGGFDTTVVIWDVFGRQQDRGRGETFSDQQFTQAWAALGDSNAADAFDAITMLSAARDRSVAFLKAKLRPIVAVESAQVRDVLRRLDSPQFAERQQARQELEGIAARVVAQLNEELAATKSSEVRQAIQQALDRLDERTPEMLRIIRSVEILEHIATAAARELLADLAKGAAGARLTEEAKASLARLKSR